jgi:cysteine synthase
VPDVASLATIHFLECVLGRRCGGSTGTNVYGSFQVIAEMLSRSERGLVVTLICDSGERYADTYYSTRWLDEQGYDLAAHMEQLTRFFQSSEWVSPINTAT